MTVRIRGQSPRMLSRAIFRFQNPSFLCIGIRTYERACIKKWLDAGHRTCPITQQIISSPILIPNHALYSLISNWCEANGV
ncbi:U-box domain-containing protein 13-like, partial [Trifolium medium]|nr:U-box domain-containing protein 13-like [Trifolium medium]